MGSARPTWIIGGAGLVLCGVIAVIQYAMPRLAPQAVQVAAGPLELAFDVLFAAAVLVFAIGSRREASVVARRPLGVAALVVYALWPLAIRLVVPFLPRMDAAYGAGLSTYREAETILATVFLVNVAVSFLAASIAAVQIARAGTVPSPWHRAPLVVLLFSVVAAAAMMFLVWGGMGSAWYGGAGVLADMLNLLLRTIGLGGIALVLALRSRAPRPEQEADPALSSG